MARDFYPFVDEGTGSGRAAALPDIDMPRHEARIAVYDDLSMAPRVVIVDPQPTREYLAEITATVASLAQERGGDIPFMIVREVVENYIHAYFTSPSISILNKGQTLRFSDQGPGIEEKDRALEYGTTSASSEMRRYIRGVGSGLPIARQYMSDHGGTLSIEDNIGSGVVVTLSLVQEQCGEKPQEVEAPYALSPRARLVLTYLQKHESVGPTVLTEELGDSQPTWSRELLSLEKEGILVKRGQKRYLTSFGKSLINTI